MRKLTEAELKEEAQKRVDFKYHLLIYVLVNAGLWVIWALTYTGYPWPVWPLLGWGIGIFFHYLGVYRPMNFFSVEKEIDKLKQKGRGE